MASIRKLRGRWQGQVRRRGMKPRCKSFDTKSEAERWARELEAQVDKFGSAPDTRILESTTLGQLILRYELEVSPLKRGAVQEIQRIKVLQRHDLAHRTLVGLSPSDISAFRDERLAQVKPATALREIAILSHIIEVAIRDWSYPLARNVVKSIRRPRINNARHRRLVDDEEIRLHAACDVEPISWWKTLFIVAVESGMRRGELLGLKWSDVDLVRGVANLELTKNGQRRSVPLSKRAVDALAGYKLTVIDPNAELFQIPTSSMELAFRRICGRAGISALTFHDLRHEAVSRMFEKGLGVMEVAAISGHKELRMLARYTHLKTDDLVAKLG